MRNTILLSLIIGTLFIFNSCGIKKNKKIKGDEHIVEKEISISDYNKIKIATSAEVFYTQNDSIPAYLKLELDSNLIEYLDLTVNGTSLKIKSQKNITIKPTKFVIHTNSKDLKEITIGGSGNIYGQNRLTTTNFKASIAGSGNIKFDSIEVYSTEVNIAGAGNITLGGTASKSSFNIAGSGNINTKELVQDTVNCKIAGSGDIELHVKKVLRNSIAGSGDIKYLGDPTVTTSIAGSGKVRKIEQE